MENSCIFSRQWEQKCLDAVLKHYAGHQSERGQKMVDNQSFRKNALKTLDLSWKSQFQRFKFFQSSQLTPLANWLAAILQYTAR
jgi:hypothetical protein